MERSKRIARLLAAAAVLGSIAEAAGAQSLAGEVFFTRRVEQLTGWSGAGRIDGQDSAIVLPDANGQGATFWFGDTSKQCVIMPNSMATTSDADASDGISLVYYEDASGKALPALPMDPATGEISVWPEAPFRRGDEVCVFHYMVPPLWPNHSPDQELGVGIACMPDGAPPFVRLAANVLPGYPHLLGPKSVLAVAKPWLIVFVNENVDGMPRTFVARTKVASVENFSSWSYWDGNRWNANPASRAYVLSNLSPPSVAWNDRLGAWIATGSIVLSADGLSSRIGIASAPSYTGPWSEPVPLYGERNGGSWGSVYNALRMPSFDQESGRRMFTTATHWGRYNVDLFETDVGHAESHFCLAASDDDADQLEGEAAPSSSGARLLLAPGSRSVVGLRLTGASWMQAAAGTSDPLAAPDVAATSLVLPLAGEVPAPFTATLRLRVGAPNPASWGSEQTSLFEMVPLSELVLDVPLAAGAREIRIGSEAAALFAAAIQDGAWRPGYDNVVPISVTRLDEYPFDLELEAREEGEGGGVWLCHGECPGAPTSLTGCRPARAFAKRCKIEKSRACGFGGEIALVLPLLALFRRRWGG